MSAPGLWIVAELAGGLPSRSTFELLAAGRSLADALGQPLGAFLLGTGVAPLANQLVRLGADRVLVADAPGLTPEAPEAWVEALAAALSALGPAWILAGETRLGTELAARLAVRLEAGLVTGCTGFETEGSGIVALRPLPDGGVARVITTGSIGLMTLRPGSYGWPSEAPERQGEVGALELPAEPQAARIRLLEMTPAPTLRLDDAQVVVAGGLGMEGHWPLLERLASLLGAAVGASRGAVQSGRRPAAEQIGLTGQVIAPRLYVACGIHGSAEHMAGLRGAPRLIAINPDPGAPIMRHADLAVCARAEEVLPRWIDALLQAANTDR